MASVQCIKAHKNQRVFVCGDIHGELELLQKALKEVGFKEGTDILVCTGDLIDRGPDSYGVLLLFLANTSGSYFSVRGNHEQFLVDQDKLNHMYNGGSWAYGHSDEALEFLGEQIRKKLPLTITIETDYSRYGVVHAEVEYGFKSWDDLVAHPNEHMCLWSRDFFHYSEHKSYQEMAELSDVECVFHGHTIVDEPTVIGNRWYIDTGGSYYGRLTIVELTSEGNKVRVVEK